ncbi:hypothetical protein HNQ07_004351 [Deinococcus metalli]|uniref:RNA ligase domain-containing protein n=1 Tax=Deinococcus metalli TaxID=1141878 RepID=A0A7W8NQA5_9DEIO|nr:DUF5565 family protein [Deinococcus metalli]MBB5378844.1 hypothetical protein [Deinococcus metalli]GHF62107.1 hypothetical protein GCM10017781_42740 [Deinococcus metalli]
MQKILSLYARNYDTDRLVRDEVVSGSEWVLAGEGVATRKWDGTSCLVRDGELWRRYDAKNGRMPPAGFEAAQEPDPVTGHHPGWVPVGDGPGDTFHREAWASAGAALPDGTYELIGPKVQGNPEGVQAHQLVRHGAERLNDVPRDFASLRAYLEARPDMEGIVWHHPDGRMVKLKRRDFFGSTRR